MRHFTRVATGLALFALAGSAAAQSSHMVSETALRDHPIQAGLIVPLGRAGSKAEHAPRLEAWSDASRVRDTSMTLHNSADRSVPVRPRIGLTLGAEPALLVNGREAPKQSSRSNVSALGWVGIGVVVVAATLGAALLGVFGSTE